VSGDSERERVDWVDSEDRVLGQVTRAVMRRRNLWHRTVAILVQDSAGAVYIHRRSMEKDLFPGLLDLFVGGVVGAGEDYPAAAKREIGEELGIQGVPLEPLFTTTFESSETRSWIAVFRCVADGPFTLEPEEVEWGDFVPAGDLDRWLRLEKFVPDGTAVYRDLAGRRPDLFRMRARGPAADPGSDLALPETAGFHCQICGRWNPVAVDLTGGEHQELIEDCTFCCSPNRLVVTLDPDSLEPRIEVREP
jgi:8-oxo-dGTP pyrophosphatase MutT (NUDIX family)